MKALRRTMLLMMIGFTGCESWEPYAEPTVLDADPMGEVRYHEFSGGWRDEHKNDGKAIGDTRSFDSE